MRLQQQSQTFMAAEDQSWLGSAHGTQEMDTITLDGSAFLDTFPTGVIPSGVVVGRITATGLYGPYTAAATAGAGSDTAAGLLFTTIDVGTDGVDSPASLFWHGEVIRAKLPADNGLDTAAEADLPQIRFV